jgi:hypothetical protein
MVAERTLPGGELTVKLWLGSRRTANIVPLEPRAIEGRTA